MMNKVILAGSGYLGEYILEQICDVTDLSVIDVCRTNKTTKGGVINIIRDFDNKNNDLEFMNNGTVIYMAPPSTNSLSDDRINNFLKDISSLIIKKIIYISTSGVYGNCDGKLVDESTPVAPITERAIRRVSAEKQLMAFAKKNKIKLIILRVPGIYGPGRLPLERVRLREPLIKTGESRITNIIHVMDLARICISSVYQETSMEIINVSDGSPLKTTAYYEYIYQATNQKLPEYITFSQALKDYSKKRISFLKESRILNVEKMNMLFPKCIKYSDAKDGIRESLLV